MFIKNKSSYIQEKLLKKVLKEYYSEIKVFIKQNADILHNHSFQNYKIELAESKQAFFMYNYKSLLKQKMNAMKKYFNKHLKKGFIRLSLSAAVASVLLVKKPSNKLRFCINYKVFNLVTIKNQCLISLINETLRKLLSITYFTQLDIIYIFNRI